MAKEKRIGEERLKNPKEELFCWLYAGYNNRDIFGNGSRCYILVYYGDAIEKLGKEIDQLIEKRPQGYTSAVEAKQHRIKSMEGSSRNLSSRMVAKVHISRRIDFLLDQLISDETMDRELAFTALQRYDLNSKVQAIREHNRLKDRGAAGRLEGTFIFGWEGEEPKKPEGKKKVVIKKAIIKSDSVAEWDT